MTANAWPRPIYDWSVLTDDEALIVWEEIYRRYLQMSAAAHQTFTDLAETKKGAVTEPLRDWWAFVEQIFIAYMTLCTRGLPIDPPLELLNSMRILAGSFAVGIVPSGVREVVGVGAEPRGPQARDNIAVGIAYVLAAQSGIIEDRSPVKSVAEAFEVDRKTVQNWLKSIEKYKPSRDIPKDPIYLREAMPLDGEAYRVKERLRLGGRRPEKPSPGRVRT